MNNCYCTILVHALKWCIPSVLGAFNVLGSHSAIAAMMFLLASLEAYTALQEVRDHGYAPCQAIELGDEEHRLFPLAVRERLAWL